MTARPPAGGLPPETLAAIKVVFFQECESHLADLDAGLIALRNGEMDSETVSRAYRAAHSIKGAAGLFQLDALARFSAQIETALGAVRDGRMALAPDVLSLLAQASRQLAELVEAGREGRDPPPEPTQALGEALTTLAPSQAESDPFEALNFEPRRVGFQPLHPVGRSGAGKA